MNEIRFEPLPEQRRKSEHPLPLVRFHMRAAEAMRSRPGEWAALRTAPSLTAARQAAYAISRGDLTAYRPAGHFEAVARTVDDEHRVYVRFIGQPEGGAA